MTGAPPSTEGSAVSIAAERARRFGTGLAGIFLLLALLLLLGGWVYWSHLEAAARAEAHRNLAAIGDLKVRQLANWREERYADAHFFAHAGFVAQDLGRFLAAPDSETNRQAVLHWLELLKSGDRYYSVLVFDAQGTPRLGLPSTAGEAASKVGDLVAQAWQRREVVFGELQRDEANGLIVLDIVFPVFAGGDTQHGAPLAGVLLKLDARQFLFPFIQSWPTPSPTGETLLVRREGDQVVYLNDLRHRAHTALALRLPLESAQLPAASVLRGDTSIVEGVDYRGVPVVAAGRLIPGTSWGIIAKIDRAEVYGPLRQQALALVAVLGALLVAAGLAVAFLWRQRGAKFLARELAASQVHEAAMERMNRLYSALSQVNHAVVRSNSREELLGQICRVMVQHGGLDMAWVGWVEESSSQVLPVAKCGDAAGYLAEIRVFADERPQGQGPVGTAIREGRLSVCNDLYRDPKLAPWCEAAKRSGWYSIAAFPIHQEEHVCGALAVYSRQQGFFGSREQDLLVEAAADVSFGLEVLLNDERRQRAEEQLHLQAAALESAANAIILTDRQGRMEWVNPAFERLTGYSAAEVMGKTPRVLRSDRQGPEFFRAMWQRILGGEVWRGELVNKRKDGSLYDEDMTVTPVRDAQGAIRDFVAIKQDISERKRAEAALQQAKEDLAKANAQLERRVQERTAQLVEANTSLQGFASTAAHDLRSPLRTIKGFTAIIRSTYAEQLTPDGRSLLERVEAASDQMAGLLQDLLEYSRMSQAELRVEPLNLLAAVRDALALLEGDVGARHAVVTVTEPFPEVIGHRTTVVLLVNNLVSNALKFMAPGVEPHIRIWAERVGDGVRLWVADNGIGIAAEDQEKVFGAFERLHGKQTYPGTGLGLAIVRRGAERMGGKAGVESELGRGSRFWIELRRAGAACGGGARG